MSVTLNRGNDVYVDIKLKREWMGNPKRSKLTLIKSVADQLVHRGTAKLIDKDFESEKELDRQNNKKILRKARKDKMQKGAEKEK